MAEKLKDIGSILQGSADVTQHQARKRRTARS